MLLLFGLLGVDGRPSVRKDALKLLSTEFSEFDVLIHHAEEVLLPSRNALKYLKLLVPLTNERNGEPEHDAAGVFRESVEEVLVFHHLNDVVFGADVEVVHVVELSKVSVWSLGTWACAGRKAWEAADGRVVEAVPAVGDDAVNALEMMRAVVNIAQVMSRVDVVRLREVKVASLAFVAELHYFVDLVVQRRSLGWVRVESSFKIQLIFFRWSSIYDRFLLPSP